jgi:hypothetical protein
MTAVRFDDGTKRLSRRFSRAASCQNGPMLGFSSNSSQKNSL